MTSKRWRVDQTAEEGAGDTMRLQYASDLHIDDFPPDTPFETFLTPCAPVLILAGDICPAYDLHYITFLQWCSARWRYVIFVAGNHEYHCKRTAQVSMEQIDTYLVCLAAMFPNVVYLQNGASIVLPGTRIRIVGATLWSSIDSAIWEEAYARRGDYKHMYIDTPYGLRRCHPIDTCALHAYQAACIASATAATAPGETCIVVTHHMPTFALLEARYMGDRWSSCYASHDDALLTPNIAYWICGHGHRAVQQRAPSGVVLCMNARGYNRPSELGRTRDVYGSQRFIYA